MFEIITRFRAFNAFVNPRSSLRLREGPKHVHRALFSWHHARPSLPSVIYYVAHIYDNLHSHLRAFKLCALYIYSPRSLSLPV